jgi:hypothetical protein
MLRNIYFIFIVLLSKITFGQKELIKPQVIVDLRKIDSLYRQLDDKSLLSLKIIYKKDDTKLTHFPYPNYADSTILDTYYTTSIKDSLAIREYCNNVKFNFSIVKELLDLMVKHKFTYLASSGPDECISCSTSISFEKNKAYVIKKLNSPCFSIQCYYPFSSKIKTDSVTKDILIAKNIPE